MRAVVMTKPGGPEVLDLREDWPLPEPEGNEVRVRLHAASVNPVDAKQRARGPFLGEPPAVLGCDGAGVIEAAGEEARAAGWEEGMRVWFCYGGLGQPRAGCYAEAACVPEAYLAPMPEGVDFVQAAALPLVAITAWEALVDRAEIEAGMRVAINGAAGGVGHVAVQIAKLFGCEVAAIVGSEEKAAFAESLGADRINRRDREDVRRALLDWTDGQGVDAALDVVGGGAVHPLAAAVRPYGDLVSILQFPEDLDWKGLRVRNVR
ncbi:MAG: alcohol dehydrogenase, partial [Zetaproteobacteria bacterium]